MFSKIKNELELHSMKLAALASTVVGWFVFNQELLFTLLSLVPVADVPRGIVAVAVAALVYLGPRIARFWPQPNVDDRPEGKS